MAWQLCNRLYPVKNCMNYSTTQRHCPLTRRSELVRALIEISDCEYIECTIAIIIIVILVRSLFLVDIMCSFG